ncbi:TPA: hypothetical protein ACS7XF_000734 [Providencia alcalifaciens]
MSKKNKKDKQPNKEEVDTSQYNLQAQIELAKINYESGLQVAKMLFLANGGAIVALLAFFSNVWSKGISNNILTTLTESTFMFGLGLFFAIVCTSFAYLSNIVQLETTKCCIKFYHLSLLVMFISGVSSSVMFLIGIYKAYSALLVQFS